MLDNLVLGLYLAEVVERLTFWVVVIACIAGLTGFVLMFDPYKQDKKLGKKLLIGSIIGFLTVTFVPNKSVIYTYLGATAVKEIAANPEVESVAKDTLKLIKKKLSEELGEENSND